MELLLQKRPEPVGEFTGKSSAPDQPLAAPANRNRAIDAYRAVAMVAVALGHWLAADARIVDGSITAGNALDELGSLHALTWLFQVMPIFFLIGGYSNAASLDAHRRAGGNGPQWVRARLARLASPSAWLAGAWLPVLALGYLTGNGRLASQAAAVAAIPLWFLANYVVDTALAPITLAAFRRSRGTLALALVSVFFIGEGARFVGLRFVPQVNIVVGWLVFQIVGFAWRERRNSMPSAKSLLGFGAGMWALSALLVAVGPWPLAMVSVPGSQFANTWPPSLALMAHGFGYCAIAIAAAPSIDDLLRCRARLWKLVAVANTMTMTSYLWHFSALAIAVLGFWKLGWLPTSQVGSLGWHLQKVPLMFCALMVLSLLIATLSTKERTVLLASRPAPRRPTGASGAVVASVSLAAGFELWTIAKGNPVFAVPGMLLILAVNQGLRMEGRAVR